MGMLIGKNDLCPCGSGKKYKKCCDGDLEYLGTENYEGKQIVYNKTKIESGRERVKELLEELLDKETKKPLNISMENGLTLLKDVYLTFDDAIDEFKKYSPCDKGCWHCCCAIVETAVIEAENIRRYVNENFDENKVGQLSEKVKSILKFQPSSLQMSNERVKMSYLKQSIPCPFLDSDNGCSIYPVRPITCRKHIVFSSKDLCVSGERVCMYESSLINDSMINIAQISGNVYREMVMSGVRVPVAKPLPSWFADGFSSLNLLI
ncbi:SEC-C metal-binding domain-containing protein [Pseudobacteroides cellulosolvens]|uniref:SEC-C motif domain protein n=1 Tax=Pseudobacteroides cellulosolvens ATCC 35603 = DSM 2933 TaxID=398512 RepID=A0A0L6JLW0_9FIRM|nr:YkgJ family cysteine cluster protein [Pseudobacteroides cellulosolvens]KNY26749.1 SEC-C motif domain protein [Pseudobacteroides cellulosolvens ATCC 35603 = DSM 2933]